MTTATETSSPPSLLIDVKPVDEIHRVITIQRAEEGHCTKPCPQCPWRKDATGVFPSQAFVHSARTAYDGAIEIFGCHQAPHDTPKTCAGFLLRGAEHNVRIRMDLVMGKLDIDGVSDGGDALHDNYRAMAVANGVAPDHPALAPCRDD